MTNSRYLTPPFVLIKLSLRFASLTFDFDFREKDVQLLVVILPRLDGQRSRLSLPDERGERVTNFPTILRSPVIHRRRLVNFLNAKAESIW